MPGVLCSSKVLEKVVVRPENASPLPERPASATRKAA
jgi:hypothetical protein